MIGKTIGNYQITDRIGAGGMGEVFRARDTKLNRDVAIKVLTDAFTQDADRLVRFEREARLLAGLNHPSIGAIYGVEEADGQQCLILELVEGEDLGERLKRGAVPVDEALEIAFQISEALEAAHEQGTVHRDLKPANIKINPNGRVKVLDFGLAKAFDTEGSDSSPDLSRSPTLMASSPTLAGVIIGTAGYMSPEQARGKTVDKRADIYAFGAVVAEMLTGKQVFTGDTVSDTLAAVLRAEPDYDELPKDTPPALVRLLKRCLNKDANRRLRDIGEARIAIEDIRSGVTQDSDQAPATIERPSFLRRYGGWLAAVIIAVGSIAAMATWDNGTSSDIPLRKQAIIMDRDDPSNHEGFDPAISPDGRYLAYVSNRSLWLRDLTTLDAYPIAGTEGAKKPFWSPDSEWIGFGHGQTVQKVPREGGRPALVASLPHGITLALGASAAWTEDGRVVVGPATGGLHQFSAQGGDVEVLLNTSEGESDFHEVTALPDGKGWVFVIHNTNGIGNIGLLTPDGRQPDILHLDETIASPLYSPTGHLVFRRLGASAGIWAVPFSIDALAVTGDPFLVAAGGRQPSLANDGALTYVMGVTTSESQVVWVTREGEITGAVGQPISTPRPFPALSPDEKSFLLTANFGETREVYLHDVASGNRRRLTFNDMPEEIAVWHPNGRDIVYHDNGPYHSHMLSLDGSSPPRRVADGMMANVTADGSQILYTKQKESSWDWDIFVRPLDDADTTATVLVATDGVDWFPKLSPDQRYIAYMSNESGQDEVYITTFPNPTTRWQASVEGGGMPKWRADGRELFYTTFESIMAVDVQTEPGLTLGTPHKLFNRPTTNWSSSWADGFDVTSDGQHFLMLQPVKDDEDAPPSIVVVQNWYAEFVASAER
jgi:serine/threonine protein kinase